MKTTMNKLFALILCLSMALSLLTGCQSGQKQQGADTSAAASASQTEEGGAGDADEAADYEMDGTEIAAYIGGGTETTTPSTATLIQADAFSWDCGHGEELEKVTVTGNVQVIGGGAFSFTAANEIYIEEGVTTIGDYAFSDSYIDEIWFPSSVTEIGVNIMMTEEGLYGTKIHLVEGSAMDEYFKQDMPYGEVELVYDYQ